MGLFDYLTCKHRLPATGAEGLEFQTKDTPSQYLDNYEIREDGTLWHGSEQEIMTGEVVFYDDRFEFSAYFVNGQLKHLENLNASSGG